MKRSSINLGFSSELNKKQKDNGGDSLVAAVKNKKSFEDIQKILEVVNNECLEERLEDRTALMYSLMNDNIKVAKLLISSGADLTAKDAKGNTILHFAVQFGTDCHFVEELLEKRNEDINSKNEDGFTALLQACKDGDLSMVKILLKHGARLENKVVQDHSPLILATLTGDVELVTFLMEAGCNTEEKNNFGETALFHVQNLETLSVLLEAGANPSAEDESGTPVVTHLAMFYPGTDLDGCLSLLLKAGADPSTTDNNNPVSVLMHTVSRRQKEETESVQILLQSGVNPSYKDRQGNSALSMAMANGRFEIVQLLLDAGANPSSTQGTSSILIDFCKAPAFIPTIILQVLQYLIAAGANVSQRDSFGKTALHYALLHQNVDFSNYLKIYDGAHICDYANAFFSPLFKSNLSDRQIVNEIERSNSCSFVQKISGIFSKLKCVVENRRFDLINMICTDPSNFININAQDNSGTNILMAACDVQNIDVGFVQHLINNGARLSAQNKEGKTALMIAFKQKNFSVVELLIRAGAKISTQDDCGNTLLMRACNDSTTLNVVRMLLEEGVAIKTKNNYGETAAIVAARKNNFFVVRTLLDQGASVLETDNRQNSVIYYIVSDLLQKLNLTKRIYNFEAELTEVCRTEEKDIFLVHEIVRVYLKLCNMENYHKLLLLTKGYLKQLVQTATTNEVSKHMIPKLYDLAIRKEITFPELPDDKFIIRKDIFEMIVESNFKDVNWTCDFPAYFFAPYNLMLAKRNERVIFPFESMGYVLKCYLHQDVLNLAPIIVYQTLQKLFDNGFNAKLNDPNIISPLSVLCQFHDNEFYMYHTNKENEFKTMAETLIKYGAQTCQHLLRFRDPDLETLRQQLLLPDALWLALQCGYSYLLPTFLPYWSAPPLALLMFMPTIEAIKESYNPMNMDEERHRVHMNFTVFEKGLDRCLDTLADVSGPLPPGNRFVEIIQNRLDRYAEFRGNRVETPRIIAEKFRTLHNINNVPGLQWLCRYVIRGSCQSSGDLPERLATLPIPLFIKNFICHRE